MKPMLKWAGGKAQLLKYVREMLPSGYNRYFEPFLGGGAVLLDLTPREATVNDINPELVNMYAQVKADVDAVVAALKALGRKEFVKTTETLDRAALSRQPAEFLEQIGAYIRQSDEFYYDVSGEEAEL